jgi:outer membrane protein W
MRLQLTFVLVSLSVAFFGNSVFAQQAHTRTYSGSVASSSSGDVAHHNYVSGALGFMAPGANQLNGTLSNGTQVQPSFTLSGFVGIGGDYDYMFCKDFSLGGLLRYYNVSTTINSQTYSNSLFVIGPHVRGYLPMENWTPYVSAGLEYMSPSLTTAGQSVTVSSGLGLMLSAGLLYKVSDVVDLGIETMRLTGLSNSINGNILEDYMLKGRFALGN